jgi:hypothetical protein
MGMPNPEDLERIRDKGEQDEMDRDPHANNAEIEQAGLWAVFQYGLDYEAARKRRVEAATARTLLVMKAANHKLKDM